MNRRGFFTRIGALIAGAFAAKAAVPQFKSRMWFVEPRPPQRLWFTAPPSGTVNFRVGVDRVMTDAEYRRFIDDLNRNILDGSPTAKPRGIAAWINDAK